MKTYEALFIFVNTLTEETLGQAVQKAQDEMTKLGAEFDSADILGRKGFARAMKKQESGYYVRFMLKIPAEGAEKIQECFLLNEEVFRIQLTKVDENLAGARVRAIERAKAKAAEAVEAASGAASAPAVAAAPEPVAAVAPVAAAAKAKAKAKAKEVSGDGIA